MVQVLDGRVGAAGHEILEEGVGEGVARARGELAVAERARAAQPEEDVRFGIEDALLDVAADVAEALRHALAHLEHRDRVALAAQAQRGRESRGPAAHHGHLPAGQAPSRGGNLRLRGRRGAHARMLQRPLAPELHRVAPHRAVARARVQRLAHDAHLAHRLRGQAQVLGHRARQRLLGRADGQGDFADEIAVRGGHDRGKGR